MKRALLSVAVFALLGGAAGCASRVLVLPRSAEPKELGYIYFIEHEKNLVSRIKRCEIQPDNSAVCVTQFELK
jgi:hypothetical protein